jgi:Secretion system C-terminal sorting domain
MKKLLCALLLLSNATIHAQITYQHTFPGPTSSAWAEPTVINLGNNEYKYFYVDFAANQFHLFNMDFTSYANLTIPITMISPQTYNIGYVTRSLFDCDTNMFEYAVLPYGAGTFYVYRQDGTLLFQKDSVIAPYCWGCYNASYDVRPIVNTPSGTKLFLGKEDTTGQITTVDVFSLCGSMPDAITESEQYKVPVMKIYPNPTNNEINFEFDLPSNYMQYELTVFNESLKTVQTIKIFGTTKKYKLNESALSSGVYFFRLESADKILQTGKFILTK